MDSFSLPAVGSETCTKITPVTAIQSSTSGETHLGNKATDAIDGIAATISHTAGGETFPWIAVQLTDDGTSVPVKRVIIINRVQDVGFRLRKMQVFVADHAPSFSNKRFEGPGVQSIGPLFTGPGKDGEIIEVTSDIAKGRFVVLQMQDVKDILSLAEITTFSN